jgi:hypothetical protein
VVCSGARIATSHHELPLGIFVSVHLASGVCGGDLLRWRQVKLFFTLRREDRGGLRDGRKDHSVFDFFLLLTAPGFEGLLQLQKKMRISNSSWLV